MATKSRKRHAPITDTDSDESLTASQSQSKSSVPKKPYIPRFLIIHSEVEGKDISLLSPFLIEKAIMSIAGELKSMKNLRSGDLLIQCRERSGSVVECLTRDRRVAGSSLTGVTALWSLSKTHLS